MCGITGIIALDKIPRKDLNEEYRERAKRETTASLEKIKHRGPDSHNAWVSDNGRVALGSTRLAINDLSEQGEQPFHDKTGSIHAVVNGEIYMDPEERAELDGWHDFKGTSDCEVVIALYIKYGPQFLSKLRGEFAVILYDAKRQHVILARDRFGIKPLFWTIAENRLIVCSEAKGLLPLGWKPEWDIKSLLDDGWVYDERTLFKGVRKVNPASYMTCISFDFIEQKPYWTIEYPDKTIPETRTEEEMILGVREQFREAVRRRLRADVPVGIYLSGGLDSSSVAGLAVSILEEECAKTGRDLEEAKKLLKCFCIGFDANTNYDETEIARRTAEHLGLQFFTVRMNDERFAEGFAEAAYFTEHHVPDLNHVGKFMLSKLAHDQGYKTILTGEGSDEHFGGYTMFYADMIREKDLQWPGAAELDEATRPQLVYMIEEMGRAPLRKLPVKRLNVIGDDGLKGGSGADGDVRATWRRNLNNVALPSYLLPQTCIDFSSWTECYGDWDPRETTVRATGVSTLEKINNKWHPLNTSAHIFIRSGLANALLTGLGDRTEMAHSVEGRPAFLDHVLAEYANGLPPSMKLRYDPATRTFNEKWILKEAMKPYLTEELYKRKKHRFSAPPGVEIGGALSKVLADLVIQENVEQLGFLDWSAVEERKKLALEESDEISIRYMSTIAQWVTISKKFGVAKAEPI